MEFTGLLFCFVTTVLQWTKSYGHNIPYHLRRGILPWSSSAPYASSSRMGIANFASGVAGPGVLAHGATGIAGFGSGVTGPVGGMGSGVTGPVGGMGSGVTGPIGGIGSGVTGPVGGFGPDITGTGGPVDNFSGALGTAGLASSARGLGAGVSPASYYGIPGRHGGYGGYGRIWCTCRSWRCRFGEWRARNTCSLPYYSYWYRTCCKWLPWYRTNSGYGAYGGLVDTTYGIYRGSRGFGVAGVWGNRLGIGRRSKSY